MGCTNSSSYSNDIKDDKNIIKYLNLIQTKPILASVSSYGYYLSAGEDKLITSLYYNYEIEPFYSDSLSSSTIQTFNGHTNMITALCFEDEHSFWSASRDNSIKYVIKKNYFFILFFSFFNFFFFLLVEFNIF